MGLSQHLMNKLNPSPRKVDRAVANTNGIKDSGRTSNTIREQHSPGTKLGHLNPAHSQAVLPVMRPEPTERSLTSSVNIVGRRQSDNGLPSSRGGAPALKAGFAASGDRNNGTSMFKQA